MVRKVEIWKGKFFISPSLEYVTACIRLVINLRHVGSLHCYKCKVGIKLKGFQSAMHGHPTQWREERKNSVANYIERFDIPLY